MNMSNVQYFTVAFLSLGNVHSRNWRNTARKLVMRRQNVMGCLKHNKPMDYAIEITLSTHYILVVAASSEIALSPREGPKTSLHQKIYDTRSVPYFNIVKFYLLFSHHSKNLAAQ